MPVVLNLKGRDAPEKSLQPSSKYANAWEIYKVKWEREGHLYDLQCESWRLC